MSSPSTKKKIAYITGTRADFGLMTSVLEHIENHPDLELKVYATGIHLMPEFGETIKVVEEKFPQTKRIQATFDADDKSGAANFCGQFIQKLSHALKEDRPDVVLVLGDRTEMLCTALVALYLGIPLAHVHGGDKSTTVDDSARHAISKIAHIHFPATRAAGERLEKMGEDVWRIHVTGAPALDSILHTTLPTREELCEEVGLDPDEKVLLVTLHPVSEQVDDAEAQMAEVLSAVKQFNLPTVVILPHADAGGRKMIDVINLEKENPSFHIFPSIPFIQFLALEREAAVWIGNSSGAMIESSSFKTPVVNVGPRQAGREHGDNVIDVPYQKDEIIAAIERSLHDADYRQKLVTVTNPWGDGNTGQRIATILAELEINERLTNKQIAY